METVKATIDGDTALADERWTGHRREHDTLAVALAEYKTASNEWRGLVGDRGRELAELRSSFISKDEFRSEHKALEAKLAGDIGTVLSQLSTLDGRLDGVERAIQSINDRAIATRSVFSDSRNVLATAGIVFGLVASALLIIDRLPK